ncbi:NUDIX hydrolase [Vibrio renipiscarius]|uniref:NUDIX hydrolase n=1 Tax=Vibrio renipiscarius TaxID=1461322 RepID=A0A0C2JJA2_9VIBR|nr:NUDIX domain-containing protein [Vibrio renipiscarius]KII76429.1 NUDIX hydrolase [Vibrio renipiscarius]KII78049.1 NUDIX hydrolase [Vibrio renipiscarius]
MEKIIDKLAWFHIREGQLLAVRSKGKTLFYLPGGKREQGESDEQALIREIQEELAVDLVPGTIQYAETFRAPADGKAAGVTVQLTCYFADFTGDMSPEAEIEELQFVAMDDKAVCSQALLVAMDWLKAQSLIR